MKKIISTFNGLTQLVAFGALIFLTQNVSAQCSLACNGNIQVSLDANCESTVTYDMLLNAEDSSCPDGQFIVELRTLDGTLLPTSPVVTGEYINQTLEAKVIDTESGNSCWGFALIEDKTSPMIACAPDTIECYEVANYVPVVTDNCDPNPIITTVGGSDNPIDCDPDFVMQMTRSFQATDAQGNQSGVCSIDVLVRRPDFADLGFPANFLKSNDTEIDCDEVYPLDDEGNPDPSYTGVPTLNGMSIYPLADQACNIFVTYDDLVFPPIGGVTKIMRSWIVTEWHCQAQDTMVVQVIEIVDDEGPEILDCPDSYVKTTSPGSNCEAYVLIPAIPVNDACSDDTRVDLTYPGGFEENWQGGVISLPLGNNEILITAYDEHLNSTECTFFIEVVDGTAPVPVCDQFTVVSLSIDGTAIVNAESFDDGSHDDCGAVSFQARRMDNGAPCGLNEGFDDTVSFCCTDATNGPVTVILRVYDEAGNHNDCMVQVEVQDKLAPVIICPADVTVDCDTPYDLTDLSEYGTPEVIDNCETTLTEGAPFENLNQCNVGFIRRSFFASDANGSSVCYQYIYFENDSLFTEADITWPEDVDIYDCVDPYNIPLSETGQPTFDDDACDLVGFDYDDKVFNFVQGENACSKVIRTFHVIDWCQETQSGFVEWEYIQIIKVINTEAPEFSGTYDPVQVCTYDNNCIDGFINLGASATDDCSGNQLAWKYSIDAFNDGTFDIIVDDLPDGNSVDASGDYPIGSHRIVYTVEDMCGNQSSQEQFFDVVNCKLPTPYCIDGLAIELMPIDTDDDGEADWAMVEIWASDFDQGSYHPCPNYDVVVSFSEDIEYTSIEYDCDDLGDNTIEMWVTAVDATGNPILNLNGEMLQDFCITNLNVQDNNNVCPPDTGMLTVDITGKIKDEENNAFVGVNVELEGGEMSDLSDDNGGYAFLDMPMGGSYDINPTLDGEDIEGVTTLDIILIQKHILGLEELPSPYKIIAADVNDDEKVSGSDIVFIRKMILGLIGENPYLNTYRFVDNGYNFLDPVDPLKESFTEIYNIAQLNSSMDVDFVALKVGDVNNSATGNFQNKSAETRSNTTLSFVTENARFENGDVVRVDITADNWTDVLGFQFTASFDYTALTYAGVEAGAIEMTNDNIGTKDMNNGIITASWNTIQSQDYSANDVLFTLLFNANSTSELRNSLAIGSQTTQAVGYNTSLEAMDVALEVRSDDASVALEGYELYQNVPNPFTSNTTIGFELPTEKDVQISILNVSGKEIYSISNTYGAGTHAVEINVDELNANGVLYYQLRTDEYTATKKMVVIR